MMFVLHVYILIPKSSCRLDIQIRKPFCPQYHVHPPKSVPLCNACIIDMLKDIGVQHMPHSCQPRALIAANEILQLAQSAARFGMSLRASREGL